MKIHEIVSTQTTKAKKRLGKGRASGTGTFAGRGLNGQNSRSGGGVRLGFEGGQSPSIKKLPKLKGFKNPNRVAAKAVNLDAISAAYKDGEVISLDTLKEKKLIPARCEKAKILGGGELTVKVTVDNTVLISESAKKALS